MLEAAFFAITITGLLIACYTDIKQRIVQNKVVYAMAGAGIALKIAESFIAGSAEPLVQSLLGGAVAFAAAYALWKLGVWAGGDVKLLTAIGLINPINYGIAWKFFGIAHPLLMAQEIPIFAISLIIFSALATMPIGMAMVISAAAKDKNTVERVKEKIIGKAASLIGLAVVAAAGKHILEAYGINTLASIPLALAFIFLPKDFKIAAVAFASAAAFWFSGEKFIFDTAQYAAPMILIYAMISIYTESKGAAFKERIDSTKISEGDIPDCFLVKKGSRIEPMEKPGIKSVINHLMNNRIAKAIQGLGAVQGVFASPMQAGGLSAEQAEELKKKAGKGLAPKTIVVKKTMAFVPAMALAYLALQLTGDLLWNIIM